MLSANSLSFNDAVSGLTLLLFDFAHSILFFSSFFLKFSLISKLGMMLQINSVHTVIFFKIIR